MRRRPRRHPTPDLSDSVPSPIGLPQDTPDGEAFVEEVGGPRRRCIATRESGERARMIRFVVSPQRVAVPDLAARLPGRGIWLSARRDVLEPGRAQGVLARALARSARGPVQIPPDLVQLLETGLARRVADTLGLARRAGQAVAGFAKAREWLTAGRCGLVVQASDGSVDERARFLSGKPGMTAVRPLDAANLGAVFGRDHVVHVAMLPGRLAELVATEAERLAGVLGQRVDAGIVGAPGNAGREQELDGRTA